MVPRIGLDAVLKYGFIFNYFNMFEFLSSIEVSVTVRLMNVMSVAVNSDFVSVPLSGCHSHTNEPGILK
jgi:hypothetical protein